MTQSSESDAHTLDRPWRTWASIAVLAIALGILPGSPARQQVPDRTPPTPVSKVVWTPDLLQILANAKAERGSAKAQEVCVACHGEQGVSRAPEYPNLAGQSGAAIYKQLNDYRTGSRTHPLMT